MAMAVAAKPWIIWLEAKPLVGRHGFGKGTAIPRVYLRSVWDNLWGRGKAVDY